MIRVPLIRCEFYYAVPQEHPGHAKSGRCAAGKHGASQILPCRGRTKSVKLPPARCPAPSESHTVAFWTPRRGNGHLSANGEQLHMSQQGFVPKRLSQPT